MFNNSHHTRGTESPMEGLEYGQKQRFTDSPFFKTSRSKDSNNSFASSSFAQASSQTAAPFRNPSFTTPRKPFALVDHSDTGAESSPGDNGDIDTPETQPKAIMPAFTGLNLEKQPIFGRYGAGFRGNSPGIVDKRRGKLGSAIANKARKRKRHDRDLSLALGNRGGSDSESDSGDTSRPSTRERQEPAEQPKPSWISRFLTGIEARPNLPNVLSYYVQLLMNFFLVALVIVGAYTFWTAIQADVDKAAKKSIALVITEMAGCTKSYLDNGCASDRRAPALDSVCSDWEHCMNQDPNMVGRAQVGARTFAEIFNSFIEPISWKAMIVVVGVVGFGFFINNMAFSMFRRVDHMPQIHLPHMPPAVAQYLPHPPQPSNFQWGPNHLPQTPLHNNVGYYDNTPYQLMPNTERSPSKGEGRRSPSKGERHRSPSKGNRSPSKGDQQMLEY